MEEELDESKCFLNSTDLTLRFEINNCLSVMEYFLYVDLNLCTTTSLTLKHEENPNNQGYEEPSISLGQNLFFFETSTQKQVFPFQQLRIARDVKQQEMISHKEEQLVGLQKIRNDGLITNQLFGNQNKSRSLSSEPMNSRSSVKTDQSLSRFSHYNRKSQIQQNHSFDNNCSQSFNFTSHVSCLQKNTPIAKYKEYGKLNQNTSLSQSQKQRKDQPNTRYANTEISQRGQQVQSQILQSKNSSRRASSPKFKLMVKQPKKSQKPEIIEITLPKEAKKFEPSSIQQNTNNVVSSPSNISLQFSKLSKESCDRLPYSKPFENKKYSEISQIVPKSKPFDSSILYKRNKSKKMHSSEINLKSFNDERLEETKETKLHQTNKHFQNDLSFFDEQEQFENEQPTHFIDLQQLLTEKQKQKTQTEHFYKREQFSFKPQEKVQELPNQIKNQFEPYQEPFPFSTKKQPVQISLNIKQFVNNNSENSDKTTSSQAFTNNQNQDLSILTFGKFKKQ